MNIVKLIRPVSFGIVFLLLLIFLVMLFGEDQDLLKSGKDSKSVAFGFGLTYALIGIAIAAILTLVVTGLRNKPKSALVSLLGFAAIVIFYFIGYGLDAGELPASYVKGGVIETSSGSKMVGGILNATLFILLIAVGFSAVSSIKDLINKING
jgi:hypothetical protein